MRWLFHALVTDFLVIVNRAVFELTTPTFRDPTFLTTNDCNICKVFLINAYNSSYTY